MASVGHGQAIPTALGVVGSAMNGSIRIPALLANCAAVMVIGEVAIRGLAWILGEVGFNPKDDSIVGKISKFISESGIRPYQDRERYSSANLTKRLIAFTALSIIATELARFIAGHPPSIYNKILTLMGPIRIDSGSYLENVRKLLASVKL